MGQINSTLQQQLLSLEVQQHNESADSHVADCMTDMTNNNMADIKIDVVEIDPTS
jgi:hypothetical protein